MLLPILDTQLAPIDHGREKAEAAIRRTLSNLQTDYLDLYLVHWPGVQGKDIRYNYQNTDGYIREEPSVCSSRIGSLFLKVTSIIESNSPYFRGCGVVY